MSKIAFYNVSKDEHQLLEKYIKKLPVSVHSEKISSRNLPPVQTEILSVHVDSKVTADVIKKLPNLRLIVTRSAGVDHIDLKAATKAKVPVANCAGLNAVSVAEFVFGLILNNYRDLPTAFLRGRGLKFDLEDKNGLELSDKTIGIIGTGSIGTHVAQIAKGFGMKIIGYDAKKNLAMAKQTGLKYMSLDKLISTSDIITLHVPAVKSTAKMVNGRFLSKMKSGALLVNTARGAVVDTKALVKVLESGRLGGYVADVLELEAEPGLLAPNRPLWVLQKKLAKLPNVLLTPHTANATQEATDRILAKTLQIIQEFLKGKKIGSVN